MTEPLGEERILIHADASRFQEELQAQVTAALAAVEAQVKAIRLPAASLAIQAATPIAATEAVAAAAAPRPAVILPPGVQRPAAQAAEAATEGAAAQAVLTKETTNGVAAQKEFAAATSASNNGVKTLTATNVRGSGAIKDLNREIKLTETSVGRLTRGTVAASAASSGLFRAVSFASGAFLVGAVAGGALAAGVQEFANAARSSATVEAVLRATGGAANVTAQQIDRLAKQQLNLTGIDDETVKQGAAVILTFRNIRNEVGAGNDVFTRAVKGAVDISTVFKTDLASSALQVGKALQDPVKGVTALRRAGITLSQAQRDEIKALVETGRTLDAQKLILGEVERQVGGTAEAIGKTLPGRLDILRERAKNALGDYVKRLQESRSAAELAAEGTSVLTSAWNALKSAVQTFGPQIVGILKGVGSAVQAIGGEKIILLIAAFKAGTIAVRTWTTAQGLFAAATAASTVSLEANSVATVANATAAGGATAATEAEAAAQLANAAAAQKRLGQIGALSAVLAIGAGASHQWTIAAIAGTAATASFGVRALAALRSTAGLGLAARAGAVGLGLVGGAAGATAIALGVAGLAAFKIVQSFRQGTASARDFANALKPLEQQINDLQGAQEQLAQNRQAVLVARVDVREAKQRLQKLRQELAASTALPGSLARRGLQADVVLQQQRLAQAQRGLDAANLNEASSARGVQNAERARRDAVEKSTKAIRDQIDALRTQPQGTIAKIRQDLAKVATLDVFGLHPPGGSVASRVERLIGGGSTSAQKVLTSLINSLDNLEQTGDLVQHRFAKAILTIIGALDRVPTQKEVSVVLTLVAKGLTVPEILKRLGIATRQTSIQIGLNEVTPGRAPGGPAGAATAALTQQQRDEAKAVFRAEKEKLRTLEKERDTRAQALAVARNETAAARDAVTAAKEQLAASRQSLVDARQAAAEARQNLRDTITAARQSVTQAVNDAKSNLNSLAQAIGQTLDQAGQQLGGQGGKLSERFKQLRDQILRGQGGPETVRAAQQVSFELNAKGAASATDFERRLTNLSDAFNLGRIKAPAFLKELNKLLSGLDIKNLRQQIGSLATDQLLAQIKALKQQAREIAQGPQRPGGGLVQQVISTANALKEAQRQVNQSRQELAKSIRGVTDAEQQIKDSNRALAAAERRLRQAEFNQRKRQIAAQDENTKVLKQLVAVTKAKNALERPKPQGKAGQDARDQGKAGVTNG